MDISGIYQIFKSCHYQLTTDSRKIIPGGVFLALKGEKFNGNAYAVQALDSGAAFVILDEAEWIPPQADERFLLVPNALQALQQLAQFHRRQFSIPVIAVCGSNGKTTTKELIGAVLSTQFQVLSTEGNFNNHIGVPLTLLRLRENHTCAVIEMGANHLEEIADLCGIAQPTHGLITSIGKDHLEGYGSVENVARSNEELFEYLRKTAGTAWINCDDPFVNEMSTNGINKIEYGRNQLFTGKINSIRLTGMDISLYSPSSNSEMKVSTHLAGRHNLQNIVGAWTIGYSFDVSPEKIAQAIANYQPANNRSQVVEKFGRQVLLDAYNANPSSVEAGLNFFYSVSGDQKAVILGDMFELGEFAESEHKRILELALEQNEIKLIACGKYFHQAGGILAHRNLRTFESFETLEKSKAEMIEFLKDRNQIFIKGSRGMAMERILAWMDGRG
jgi:UDP-N-acetylmuramoyl-tripeptide--D-alanyl-D-alanine ligase